MDEKQLQHARASWCNRGKNRPDFALTPGAGQESVWDYPRPPVIVDDTRRVRVKVGNVVLADSCEAIRVLETASPPTFYLPPCDIRMELFSTGSGQSFCEWKGHAEYLDYCVGGQCIANIAWY